MNPVVGSLALQAGTGLLEGMAGRRAAMAEKQRADNNAFIGRTRAIQTSTAMREDLNSELASMRAVMATNGQRPNVGTFEMMRELRETRSRERRVAYGNEMMGVYDQQMASRNAQDAGRAAMIGGITKAAGPLMQLYQYKRGPTRG
jgi:hypothetical protein